jgi:predicted lipoprotein with Yx(FWY)xxD motif
MKRSMLATAGFAGITLMAAACSGSGYSATGAPPTSAGAATANLTATTVATANSPLGPILVDSQGRSLYLFEADSNAISSCTSAACVAEWPPVIASGTAQVGPGLAANLVGTTARPDGHQQVTYSGHPLYYFAGDSQAGTTSGQGLDDNGGLWYAVHTNGTAVVGQ